MRSSPKRTAPPGSPRMSGVSGDGDLLNALGADWGREEAEIGRKIGAKAQEKGVEISREEAFRATRDFVRA